MLDDGVSFNGKRYRSLSEVARGITGSRWSGPRFFGLRTRRRRIIMEHPKSPIRRCAIYTRKSSEEGLEQDFNSLHAHARPAKLTSRATADEGGACSRSPMMTAALRRDPGTPGPQPCSRTSTGARSNRSRVQGRPVDPRADRFRPDGRNFRHSQNVFVAVTQPFNTTRSIGRLTLNVCCLSPSSSAK